MSGRPNLLVIKLSALGDFIQALGPMAAIRQHHPDAHITLLTTKPFSQLGEACGYFDEVWVDKRPRWNNPKGWLRLRQQLRSLPFARVYDLQNNDRTSLYLKMFSTRGRPEWIGAAGNYAQRNSEPTATHAFDRHVQTLACAGITDIAVDRLDWMQADLSRFGLTKPFMLLVPGSAPQHPQKRWPASYYAQLACFIARHGFQPVILGTDADQEPATLISTQCPQALNLIGQTSLFDLPTLAREAVAAIGNDTGPMHLLAPTGCPSWVLFSNASNPQKHAPKGRRVTTIQREKLENLLPEELEAQLYSLIAGDGSGVASAPGSGGE